VDGQAPVFITARGSKLSAAEGQNLVAFEADEYDERTHSGWSVLVNGRAQAVYEDAEIQRLSRLGLHSWVTAVERPFWIRIRPTSISGRQTPAPGLPGTLPRARARESPGIQLAGMRAAGPFSSAPISSRQLSKLAPRR